MEGSESFEMHVAGLNGLAEKLEAELAARGRCVSEAESAAQLARAAQNQVRLELEKVRKMLAIAEGKAK
jgi:hypothetical protein